MSHSDQIIKEFKLFTDALGKGIIDMDLIAWQIEMVKRKEYLDKHKSKIWEGSNGYWYTYLKDGGRRRLIKKPSREAVEDVIVEFYKEPEEDPTFRKEYQEWIGSRKEYKEVKESSILRYEDDYKRFFEGSEFERLKVSKIDDLVLDDFVRKVIADFNLTAKAYSGFRTVLIGVMKYAKRRHHTSFSIAGFFNDFQISKSAFKKPAYKQKKVYSKDERVVLYEYLMANPTIQNLGLALMCLTGLRIGELAALKKEDNIKPYHLYIHRTESVYHDGKKKKLRVQDSPKMDHEETIIIPKAAQRVIDLANMRTHDEEYLFSRGGVRVTTRSFRCALKKACKEAGIVYKSPHQMRKTYASILLSSKVDEAIIKREMRHSEIATTRSYYQYITTNDNDNSLIIDEIAGL